MTLDEARKIVHDDAGHGIFSRDEHNCIDLADDTVCLDGYFTATELEAIVIVMRADRLADREDVTL